MPAPLTSNTYILKKFPGKGGWTYAEIPEIPQDKQAPFGWVKVRGTIDAYKISDYHLMPMGNGHLFMPVKAEIRKKIKKHAGDSVVITLFKDDSVFEIPQEFMLCLEDEPAAKEAFNQLKDWEKRMQVKWIYSAKREETRINRIIKTIEKLLD